MLRAYGRYFDFGGRSGRPEYWLFVLFHVLTYVGLAIVDGALIGWETLGTLGVGPLSGLFALGSAIPATAVTVRRLHDTGRSGWWVLISLVPVVGAIVLLVWQAGPGEPGPNRFGPPHAWARPAGWSAPAPTPATGGPEGAEARRLETLERLAGLRERGALTDAEFEAEKRRLLPEATPKRVSLLKAGDAPRTASPSPAPAETPAPFAAAPIAAGRPRRSGPNWGLVGGLAAAALLIAVIAALRWNGVAGPDAVAEEAYLATGAANVRSAPRTEGSQIVGALSPGDRVQGRVREGGGGSRWLEVTAGSHRGAFVWLGNLAAAGAEIEVGETVSDEALQRAADAAAAAAAAAAVEPERSPPAPALVGPDGWGQVRIGMTAAQAEAAVGAPLADFSPDEESDCRILGPSATPDVSFMVEDGRVTTVRVGTEPGGSSAVRTPEGVGLGSSRTVVKAAYPSAVLEENIYGGERAFVWNADRSRGLRFDISEGRVTAMEAGTRSIEYVEGCL